MELFRRTAKSLALTDAGSIFLGEARAVLLRADEAVNAARAAAKKCSARLRVGYAPSLTALFLPPTLRAFEAEFPGVKVDLHDLSSEECRARLAAGKLDLALTIQPPGALKNMAFQKLTSYPLYCAVSRSHPLAGRKSVRLAELADEPFVAYTEADYPEYMDRLRELARAAGFRPNIVGEYDGASGLITAVESGRGVALVASTMGCLSGPRLSYLTLRPAIGPLLIGALYPKASAPVVGDFVRVAQAAARKHERIGNIRQG